MYRFASAAAFALLLLACGAAAVDPKLGEFKKIPKDSIASLLLVDTSFYADPSQVEIHVNCPPDKGNLSLSYPPETASPGTLLFKPYAGAFGQDFFTFTVTGPLKGGLTSEQVRKAAPFHRPLTSSFSTEYLSTHPPRPRCSARGCC